MKTVVLKKARHRCSAPGCRATHTYLFARTRNFIGSVYLCDECLREFYKGVFEASEAASEEEESQKGDE